MSRLKASTRKLIQAAKSRRARILKSSTHKLAPSRRHPKGATAVVNLKLNRKKVAQAMKAMRRGKQHGTLLGRDLPKVKLRHSK